MKILHAGIFIDHELGGDIIFEKGLIQNGYEVERFDYRNLCSKYGLDIMYQLLLDRVRNKDVLFIGKGELFNSNILKKVKQLGVTIVLWYGDIRIEPESWLLDILQEVDFYFMSSAGEILNYYFVKGRPKVAAYYFNPSDPQLNEKYKFLTLKNREVIFTGTNHALISQERKETMNYLRKRSDTTILGGADNLITGNNILLKVLAKYKKYRTKWVRGYDYIQTIKSAKIGIGVSAFQNIPMYTSDRLTHYLTFGTFFLPWEFPGIDKLFKIEKEIVCFNGIEDLERKITYYLNEEEEREAIALEGQKRVNNDYNCKNIVGMMFDIICEGNSKRFQWVEVLK